MYVYKGSCINVFGVTLSPVAYLGFHFGGGVQNFSGKVGVFALLGGFGGMLPQKIFKNGAIWCVLESILLKFCKKK